MLSVKIQLITLALIGAVTLSGCMTSAERAAKANREAAQRQIKNTKTCKNFGFEEKTPEFKHCVSLEERQYQNESKASKAATALDIQRMASCLTSGGSYGGGICHNY